MALETGNFISDLVATNPTTADPKSQGDDHLRLIKSTLKNTFAFITGAVTASHTELNFVKGVTSAIQAQIDSKGVIAGQIWSGIHNFTSATITVATQAFGDSSNAAASTQFVATAAFSAALPAQTGNAGKFVTTDGENASWEYPDLPTSIISTNVTIASFTRNLIDTSGGVKTITLPAAPSVNDIVEFADYAGTWAINNATVASNALKIMGAVQDLILNVKNGSISLIYSGEIMGWIKL